MNEKLSFSNRLSQALRRAKMPESPTRLALEFNLRYWGKAVTSQAVRKWLHGGAIPSQDKIIALARWLGVSAEWLRFGSEAADPASGNSSTQQDGNAFDRQLCADLGELDDTHKRIVREMVNTLLHIQQESKKQPA